MFNQSCFVQKYNLPEQCNFIDDFAYFYCHLTFISEWDPTCVRFMKSECENIPIPHFLIIVANCMLRRRWNLLTVRIHMYKYYLFICGLFNDTVSSSENVASSGRIIIKCWIRKDSEGGGHESWKGIVGFVFTLLCIKNSIRHIMSNGRMDASDELGRG